jgi:Ca2+-binding EF-hand superfamily protein
MIPAATSFGTLALAVLFSAAMQHGGQKGKGRAGKPPPKSSAPVKPGAGSQAPRAPDRKTPEQYFEVCDYNGDGVVAFDEAHASLGIDQDGFKVYDVDRDGLISLAEFKTRYLAILDKGGAFTPPVPKAKARKPARRTPEELLAQFDKNEDGALDVREIKAALEEYQIFDLAPDVALEKLDRDSSSKLELLELDDFSNILSPKVDAKRAKKAKSIDDLFGQKIPREVHVDSTPLPPRIAGPVWPFRRLDFDGDGKISTQDLNELQRPLQLSVRINAVIASLDVDGDGVVSEKEFWASMASGRATSITSASR